MIHFHGGKDLPGEVEIMIAGETVRVPATSAMKIATRLGIDQVAGHAGPEAVDTDGIQGLLQDLLEYRVREIILIASSVSERDVVARLRNLAAGQA